MPDSSHHQFGESCLGVCICLSERAQGKSLMVAIGFRQHYSSCISTMSVLFECAFVQSYSGIAPTRRTAQFYKFLPPWSILRLGGLH